MSVSTSPNHCHTPYAGAGGRLLGAAGPLLLVGVLGEQPAGDLEGVGDAAHPVAREGAPLVLAADGVRPLPVLGRVDAGGELTAQLAELGGAPVELRGQPLQRLDVRAQQSGHGGLLLTQPLGHQQRRSRTEVTSAPAGPETSGSSAGPVSAPR